jgi:hypothetical protein
MQSGDTEFAFFSLAYYNIHAYLMGLPLDPIIEESGTLIDQINHYECDSVRAIVLPFHQMLLSLSGRTEDPLAWVRASEGQDNTQSRSKKKKSSYDPSDTVKIIWSYMSRGQIAYYFEEPAIAGRIWTKLKPLLVGLASYSAPTIDIYFSGLIGTAMYRKTGKRKHLDQARRAVQNMKGLMENFTNTGLNNLHRYYILQADYCATVALTKQQKKQEVRKAFDLAISASSKAGFLQDAALANELCARYFIQREDLFWAKHYMTSAYHLYSDWGAAAKAHHLMQTYRVFIIEDVDFLSRRMSTASKGPLSTAKLLEITFDENGDDPHTNQLDHSTITQDDTWTGVSFGNTISS